MTNPHRLPSFWSLALLLATTAIDLPARDIWVDPAGDDTHVGTAEAPLATIGQAQRLARNLRRTQDPSIADGVRIVLRGGTYRLADPLRLRWEDSGTAESPLTFAAAPGESPVISGGLPVTGWHPQAGTPYWVAEAPRLGGRPVFIRTLWNPDGQRLQRAREADGTDFKRVIAWDKDNQQAVIDARDVARLGEPNGLEFVIHQMWAIAILRVREIQVKGDEARLRFFEPEHTIQFEHPWPPVVVSEDYGNSAYYLANRREFVDEPGEWYQDPTTGRITYFPRLGETPASFQPVAPVLETLVEVQGVPERPVSHVVFEGIEFAHTDWKRPGEAGHVPLQAGFSMTEAYKLRPPGTADRPKLDNQAWVERKPAAVELRHTRQTVFRGCTFTQLASSGLDYIIGAKGDTIEGNIFRDIGGSGFVIGAFQEGGVETHIPYDSPPAADVCEGTRFVNNLVTDIAHDDWGCIGVLAGYVRGVEIAHNEISDVAYTGISLGWGWTPTANVMRDNVVRANHIHHFGKYMYDTGGIYTLSDMPGTVIAENAIHSINRPTFVHDPYHWSYIYLDEGSSDITVENNWTEGIKFSTNANGPGNVWRGNGPDADPAIRQNAGLQAPFRHLLDHSELKD